MSGERGVFAYCKNGHAIHYGQSFSHGDDYEQDTYLSASEPNTFILSDGGGVEVVDYGLDGGEMDALGDFTNMDGGEYSCRGSEDGCLDPVMGIQPSRFPELGVEYEIAKAEVQA